MEGEAPILSSPTVMIASSKILPLIPQPFLGLQLLLNGLESPFYVHQIPSKLSQMVEAELCFKYRIVITISSAWCKGYVTKIFSNWVKRRGFW